MAIKVQGVLDLDGSGWDRTLRKAEEGVNHLGHEGLSELKGMVGEAFTVGAVIEFTRRTIEAIAQIKQFSEQFGITTDEVQELQRAARHVGLEFGDVGRAILKLGEARRKAGEGSEKEQHAFERFGVTMADINNRGLSTVDLMKRMTASIEEMKSSQNALNLFGDLVGVKGEKVMAVLDELGHMPPIALITPEQITEIDEAKKKLEDLKTLAEVMAAKPISDAAGILTGKTLADKYGAYLKLVSDLNLPGSEAINLLQAGKALSKPTSAAGIAGQSAAASLGATALEAGEPLFTEKIDESKVKALHEAERLNRLSGMTTQEKINELAKEELDLRKQIADETNGNKRIELETKLVQLDTDRAGLQKSLNRHHPHTDSLVKVGNFLGSGGAGAITTAADRTNSILTVIHTTLQTIATNTGKPAAIGHSLGAGTIGVPP